MQNMPVKHRWFQFGLLTLLVFVALCAIAFGWLAVAIVEGRRERKAEVALAEMGYIVACSGEPKADWLGDLFEADIFRHVRYVAAVRIYRGPNFRASAATKQVLEYIRDLHQLEELEIELDETQITDDELENLRELDRLKELEIYGSQITDAGLKHLRGLSHLRRLGVAGTKVTDAGVKTLQQALPNCKIDH